MPPKYRTTRRPKRKFSGNQFTEPSRKNAMSGTEEANEEARGSNNLDQHSKKSVSSKKLLLKSDAKELKPRKAEEPYEEEATITGFRFVDMELLGTAFSAMRCADCGEFSIVLSENHLERKGCASSLRVFCENCGWKHEFWTSKKQTLSFEVNRRLVYSMRSIGRGHSGAKKFCTFYEYATASNSKGISEKCKNDC